MNGLNVGWQLGDDNEGMCPRVRAATGRCVSGVIGAGPRRSGAGGEETGSDQISS